MKTLSFVNVIYEVKEWFLFIKRFYERFAQEEVIHVAITLTGIKDRRLISTGEGFLAGGHLSRESELLLEDDYSVSELRASAEEVAIKVVVTIFELFNWNAPDPGMIRGWQVKLLTRTF